MAWPVRSLNDRTGQSMHTAPCTQSTLTEEKLSGSGHRSSLVTISPGVPFLCNAILSGMIQICGFAVHVLGGFSCQGQILYGIYLSQSSNPWLRPSIWARQHHSIRSQWRIPTGYLDHKWHRITMITCRHSACWGMQICHFWILELSVHLANRMQSYIRV